MPRPGAIRTAWLTRFSSGSARFLPCWRQTSRSCSRCRASAENAVTLLRLIPEVSRRYLLDKTPSNEPIDSAEAAGRYFIPRFMYETEETVYALLLDARKRPHPLRGDKPRYGGCPPK